MATEVKVDFDPPTNQLTIRSGTKEKRVNIQDLFDQFHLKPKGISTFSELNTAINHGDSVKDGTNQAILSQLDLYQDHPLSLFELKDLAHSIIDECKTNGTILRQVFTRDKKGDTAVKTHYQGMQFDVGFDSGLGLDNYLEDAQRTIFDTFGKYIDPSSFREVNKSFPQKNYSLSITADAFKQIGYENCVLSSATNIGKDQYNYNMSLAGSILTHAGASRKHDENINTILVGNAKKKAISDRQQKIAAVIGKGLGDKLQVFILFIKSVFEPSDRISCISTCDEIVLLFCVLLKLPCFYTSIGVDKKMGKINEVLYYNVDNTSPAKALIRFNTEKNIVKKAYTDLIKLLRTINSSSVVYLSGDTKSYSFRPEFYQGLILDLEDILAEVNATVISSAEQTDVQSINAKTGIIQSMTVNQFIKKNRDGGSYLLIRTANKYSDAAKSNPKSRLAEQLGISKNLTSATFFSIGNDYAKSIPSEQRGGNPVAAKETLLRDLDFFDLTPAIVYQTVYSSEEEHPKTIEFDANASLWNEILQIAAQKGQARYFADIYTELLMQFQSDPNYRTSNISSKIDEIVQDIQYILSVEPEPRHHVIQLKRGSMPKVNTTRSARARRERAQNKSRFSSTRRSLAVQKRRDYSSRSLSNRSMSRKSSPANSLSSSRGSRTSRRGRSISPMAISR